MLETKEYFFVPSMGLFMFLIILISMLFDGYSNLLFWMGVNFLVISLVVTLIMWIILEVPYHHNHKEVKALPKK